MNLLRKNFLIFAFFVFAGCRIEFQAQSVVRDDGSIERSTSFRAQDKSDREELAARYALPEGGVWKDAPANVFKFFLKKQEVQMFSSYETNRVVAPGSPSFTDFKRFTLAKDRAASNQFRVRVKDRWLVKWFDYEEKFTDTVDVRKVKLLIEKVMEKGLAVFRDELSARLHKPELMERIISEARVKYGGLLGRYYTLATDKGWNFKGVEALNQEVEKALTSEAASQFLAEKFPELDNEPGRKAVGEAFHATGAVMDQYLSRDPRLQAEGQDVFGAHGFPIFQVYDFTVGVKMPGRVLESNAGEAKNGVLVWKFSAETLAQTLHARSRKIYPLRISALAAAIFFSLLGYFFKRSFDPKNKKRK